MGLKLDDRELALKQESAADLLAKPASAEEATLSEAEVPISELRAGESGVVKSYGGGRGMLGRCLSMGFTPGSPVRMIENYGRGPILVSVCDTEVALGREIAGRIMVTRKRS
jgi:Fe2+ transport system protein FeoA